MDAVETQGRAEFSQYVTSYSLASVDKDVIKPYMDDTKTAKVTTLYSNSRNCLD